MGGCPCRCPESISEPGGNQTVLSQCDPHQWGLLQMSSSLPLPVQSNIITCYHCQCQYKTTSAYVITASTKQHHCHCQYKATSHVIAVTDNTKQHQCMSSDQCQYKGTSLPLPVQSNIIMLSLTKSVQSNITTTANTKQHHHMSTLSLLIQSSSSMRHHTVNTHQPKDQPEVYKRNPWCPIPELRPTKKACFPPPSDCITPSYPPPPQTLHHDSTQAFKTIIKCWERSGHQPTHPHPYPKTNHSILLHAFKSCHYFFLLPNIEKKNHSI